MFRAHPHLRLGDGDGLERAMLGSRKYACVRMTRYLGTSTPVWKPRGSFKFVIRNRYVENRSKSKHLLIAKVRLQSSSGWISPEIPTNLTCHREGDDRENKLRIRRTARSLFHYCLARTLRSTHASIVDYKRTRQRHFAEHAKLYAPATYQQSPAIWVIKEF